jgi:tetratricopeptide (TPR) repeat protein
MGTAIMSEQATPTAASDHAPALLAALATVRAIRPDLAEWCERVPVVAPLFCTAPWAARWATLPDASAGSAALLLAWQGAERAPAPAPDGLVALATAQALDADPNMAWPHAGAALALVARCLIGLAAQPAQVARRLALAGAASALAAALDEPAAQSLDASALLAELPATALPALLAAAAEARHPAAAEILGTARAAGCANPDLGAALVSGLLPHDPAAATALAQAIAAAWPDHSGARLALGRALSASSDHAGAAPLLAGALADLDRAAAAAAAELAAAEDALGHPSQARAAWVRALGRNPAHGRAAAALARRAHAAGRAAHAARVLAKAVERSAPADLPELLPALHQIGAAAQLRVAIERLSAELPEAPAAAYYAGLLHRHEGDAAQARAALARAILLAPRWPAPRVAHADLLRAQGLLAEAAADYLAVLDRDPAHTAALAGLSDVRARQGDLPAAIALAKTLVRVAPDDAAHHGLLADHLLVAGRAAEALPAAQAAAERSPATEHAVRLARAQLATGAATQATATLKSARERVGEHPALLATLSESAAAAGDWQAALDARAAQFRQDRDAASARATAQAARAAGDLAEARAWLAVAARCAPTNYEIWLEVAAVHRDAARPRASIRAYQRALRCGAPATTQRGLAQAYAQAGDLPAAIAGIQSYLAGAPQDAAAWHLLGRLHLRGGNRSGAIDAAERIAALPGVPGPIACWAIDALAGAGMRGRARAAADAAVAADPQDAALRVRRAGLLFEAGALAEARADALAALTRQRDLVPARVILARIQLREAAYPAARATLAPLAGAPQHADTVSPLLAEALEGCGEHAEALPHALHALQVAPADHARRARLARVLLATGEPQRAAALLAGAPDLPDLLILRAQATAALGDTPAAERDAREAARLAPDSPQIALVAGTLSAASLTPADAREHWLALSRRFPADDSIRQRAAQALLAADDAVGAITLLRPLVERAAADAETAGLMGRAYLRAGRTQDGVRTLRYAVRCTDDPARRAELQLALAEAYAALGWADDALATLDTLLADMPGHAPARRERARLALEAGQLETAAADLAALAGDDPDTAELAAELAARQGDWQGALVAMRHACAAAPTAARLARLAELGASAGDRAAELAALVALAANDPAPANWAALAEAHAAGGDRAAAHTAWQRALGEAAPAAWWAAYGRLLLADGDPIAARAAFGRALALDPSDSASADALAELTDIAAERIELLRHATAHAPQNAGLWRRLAEALQAAGAGAEACQAYGKACALTPDDASAAADYAEALLAAGDRLAAVEVLERACAAPDAPAHLLARLAAVLTDGLAFIGDLVRLPAAPDPARQRLTARADELLAQARARDPQMPAWWIQSARLGVVAGDYAGARALLDGLPWDQLTAQERVSAHTLRAVARARAGALADAAADASQALEGPDAPVMRAILAEAAYASGDAAAAYEHAHAARHAGADSAALLATLGQAALEQGRAAEACEALELALEQATDAHWLDALSRAYAQLDRRERAIEYAARAVRAAPSVAAYQHNLATLYQHQRRMHDARAALIRALSLQPDKAIWHAQMAEICDALGMTQAAAQSLAQARALAPQEPAILVSGAQLRAAQGDAIGALGDYRQALAQQPGRVDWHVAAAQLARTSGQAADFIRHAHAAVEQAPNDSAHWLLLAEAAEMNRDGAAALAVLEDGLKRLHGDRTLTLSAARRASALGQPARAQALLDAWLDQSPDDAEAWELAGAAAYALGDAGAARRALERAVRIAPRRASAHATLARLALAIDDSNMALHAAANASDYDPLNQGNAILLARALHAAQRVDEARAVTRAIAPEALPADGEICRWYAELQLLDGDPTRAIAALERAIEQTPDVPELHLWAGRAHRQLRHYRRAITHLRRAIRLRPSYPEAIIELSSLGPLAFAAHAAHGDGADEKLSERVA